jgi:hypothetical protein
VADAVEAAGEYVNEESADELVGGKRHYLGPLAPVCTENPIRVDDVMESPKLAE